MKLILHYSTYDRVMAELLMRDPKTYRIVWKRKPGYNYSEDTFPIPRRMYTLMAFYLLQADCKLQKKIARADRHGQHVLRKLLVEQIRGLLNLAYSRFVELCGSIGFRGRCKYHFIKAYIHGLHPVLRSS